ncbi:S-layer homology domain-containing protein [Peptoniphilus sp. KCTC 25270]|uniref:S-layer homology domain-containing protein n=1 Tax=Peptoniphilus sp. KCTC 25270 TaxID=2897414 RepID=UPI001E47B6F5|nr:S-layer homology domain-containing protein [Peptoniphilus sp. KCTC 25270]MCD1147266.1 S-layer homology domain-containing protein [Peptoniphilus sp. KCTC 25270]
MKKKILAAILSGLCIFSMAAPVYAANFKDMPDQDNWAYSSLKFATDKGYLTGFDDGTLRPWKTLTRAQLIAIMNRVMGNTKEADLSAFTDVSRSDWFYHEIAKGVAAGITTGTSEITMSPNKQITREEGFTILARVMNVSSSNTKVLNQFFDGNKIRDWAKPGIIALIERGIVSGSEGYLSPDNDILRAEFAKIIYMYVGNPSGKEEKDPVVNPTKPGETIQEPILL